MNKLPVNLHDLVPRESTFMLSTTADREFKLCRWSLRVRVWATEKYTSEGLQQIFEQQKIDQIADLAWFMLRDESKKFFQDSKSNFLDSVVTFDDQVKLIKALLETIGIGEPEIEKIATALGPEAVKGPNEKAVPPGPKRQASKTKIGAKPSTR